MFLSLLCRKRSAGGKVVLIQSSTDRLTMQQAMERGGKPSSPPPSEQGRTTSPRTKKRDFTAAPCYAPATNVVEIALSQKLPDHNKPFSSPEKTCMLKSQGFVPLREKSGSDECVLPKKNIPQPATGMKNISENHELDTSSKAVTRYGDEIPCTPSSQKEFRAALPKGSPKLPLRIKSSLNRSRSSSLPVICPDSHSSAKERKITHVQPSNRVNKEILSIKRVDDISSEICSDIKDKCNLYASERETALGSILRSPSNISKATLNKTEMERSSNKYQIPDEFSGKAECSSEQPNPPSRIPVSVTDIRWKTPASRIPKVVQGRPSAVTSQPATENELKVNKRIKTVQQKNSTIQNVTKKEKPPNQLDKEALQMHSKRERADINAKRDLEGKHATQKTQSSRCLEHASGSLNEEEVSGWQEEKKIFFISQEITEPSKHTSTTRKLHENVQLMENIKGIGQETLGTDFISQGNEDKNYEYLVSDILQDNESKDVEANVLDGPRQ